MHEVGRVMVDDGFGGWWGCGFWGWWWATDNTDGGWRVEDGVEDDVEEFLGEAVEVGLEGGGGGVGVGHGFFVFFFSFLLVMLGAWGGGSSCFFTCYFTIASSSTDIRKSWGCGDGSGYLSICQFPLGTYLRYRSFSIF